MTTNPSLEMNMTNGGWYSSQLDEGHKPPQVHVKIEDVGGKLLFTVEVVADEPGEYTADIRGLVFQVADDSVLGSLKISPNGPERYDVTAKAFAAGGTNIFPKKDGLIDSDLNVNGPGNDITWDIAVQIGEPGNDGITRTSFVLESTAGPLSLEDIDDNLYFGVRLKSVTEVGSDQGLSDKILFTSPPYSAPPPAPLKASLGDRLWEDTNNNGKQDDGDTGLDGVTVHLLDEAGHPVLKDGVAITTVTKDGGLYKFENLTPGKYKVQFDTPAGYKFTTVDAVGADDTNDSDADASGITGVYDLTAGEYDDTADAGVVLNPPPVLPPGRHDDLIEGGDGNDVIYGGFGNDEIQGEGGKDHITGGVDDGKVLWSGDKLAVAIGDNLYGNNGTDTYHYAKGDGVDMIWDFRPGEDVIDVQGFDPSQVKVTYVEGVTNWIGTGAHKKLTLTFGANEGAIVFNDFPNPNANDVILRFGSETLTWAQLVAKAQATTAGASITGIVPDRSVPPLGPTPVNLELPGGNGNDILGGTDGTDLLYGNNGYNWLEGFAGNDQLFGGNQEDVLLGGEGRDRLYGNEGINWLEGDAGEDELYGGNQQDTLQAGSQNDSVYGNGGSDVIVGGLGSDKLYGAGGDDIIYGDDGPTLTRPTKPVIDGPAPTPTVVTPPTSPVVTPPTVVVTQPEPEVFPEDDEDEVLEIVGTSRADRLTGTDEYETLLGLSGNDIIDGRGGDDIIEGGNGRDALTGGMGAASRDTFVFDSPLKAANADLIKDFESKYDQIFLDESYFKGLGHGTEEGTAISKGMFVANTSGEATSKGKAQIVYETDTGRLFYDKDGKGGADGVHFATLTSMPGVTFRDFEII